MSVKIKTQSVTKMPEIGQSRLITGEELYRMGDIGPTELVRGEIVHHMPTGHPHGLIENIIGALLYIYLQANKIGYALTGEVGIYTQRNPDSIRAADIAFISNERYQQLSTSGYLDQAPELVIEIMSPSNTWSEIHEKLAEYFGIGVKLVWVVDSQLEQVHVYRAMDNVTLLQKEDTLTGGDVLPGFEAALTEIFIAES